MLEYYRFKAVHDLFVKGKMDEARRELAELQRRYVTLCDENTTFKMQLQEYEDILYLARNLVFDGRFYWLETGSMRQGPFCPQCYDEDGLLMRLSGEREERFCTTCRISFQAHRVEDTAVAVPHEPNRDYEPEQDFVFIPSAHAARRRAKVIPFSR